MPDPMLAQLQTGFTASGNLTQDVIEFFTRYDCPHTARHCEDVAAESRRLAMLTGADPDAASIAGWLHDISAVIPVSQRIATAEQFELDILPEEIAYPMIIHQKLSVVIAREIFHVTDTAILSAIGCHTTLKQDASLLDTVVFVADKIAWDRPGTPPYQTEILAGLNRSIDHAALVYLDYLWHMRDKLRVIHPWFVDAHRQLSARLRAKDG